MDRVNSLDGQGKQSGQSEQSGQGEQSGLSPNNAIVTWPGLLKLAATHATRSLQGKQSGQSEQSGQGEQSGLSPNNAIVTWPGLLKLARDTRNQEPKRPGALIKLTSSSMSQHGTDLFHVRPSASVDIDLWPSASVGLGSIRFSFQNGASVSFRPSIVFRSGYAGCYGGRRSYDADAKRKNLPPHPFNFGTDPLLLLSSASISFGPSLVFRSIRGWICNTSTAVRTVWTG